MSDKRHVPVRQDDPLTPNCRSTPGAAGRDRGGTGPTEDDRSHTLTCAVAVRRQGRRAWVRVTGQLTPLTDRHLDDWLDWLISTGAMQVTVSLATVDHIDEACLRVLRVAQVRLRSQDGELLVTAGRAQVRAALTWTTRATDSRIATEPQPAVNSPRDTAAMSG
jgi:anti-anti-sigma regulatory factor